MPRAFSSFFAGFVLILLAAWPAHAQTYSATQVADALRNSPYANTFLVSNAGQIGNLAMFESSGQTNIYNGSCCYGILQMNGTNLRSLGISPNEYMQMNLQQQVDAWARIQSQALNDPILSQLQNMSTFDGQPVDAAMMLACVQLGQGNCRKMIQSGKCNGFEDRNGTDICEMADKIRKKTGGTDEAANGGKGGSGKCFAADHIQPTVYVHSPFGFNRGNTGGFHLGIDTSRHSDGRSQPNNTDKTFAVDAGKYSLSGSMSQSIKLPDGRRVKYLHSSVRTRMPTNEVKAGDEIGLIGKVATFYPHSHLELEIPTSMAGSNTCTRSGRDQSNCYFDPNKYKEHRNRALSGMSAENLRASGVKGRVLTDPEPFLKTQAVIGQEYFGEGRKAGEKARANSCQVNTETGTMPASNETPEAVATGEGATRSGNVGISVNNADVDNRSLWTDIARMNALELRAYTTDHQAMLDSSAAHLTLQIVEPIRSLYGTPPNPATVGAQK